MTVEALASQFRYAILRGDAVVQDGVHVKGLVLVDLIQNAHTLFDKRHSLSLPAPSSSVADTMSAHTHGSIFFSPELPQPAEVQVMGSASRHRPWLFDGIPTATQLFPSIPSDTTMDIRLTSSPTSLLSPLLGLSSSRTPTEGWETSTQGQVMPEVRYAQVVETLEASVPPTSTAEWRSRPLPQPAVTKLQSPTKTVQSSTSTSYTPASSATSLQTRRFSP